MRKFLVWFTGFIAITAATTPYSEQKSEPVHSLKRRGFDQAGRFTFDNQNYIYENTVGRVRGVTSDKIQWFKAALEDAITLANYAKDIDANDPAFRNYFYKAQEHPNVYEFDRHLRYFKKMMEVIADPSRYYFVLNYDQTLSAWADTESRRLNPRDSRDYVEIRISPTFLGYRWSVSQQQLVPSPSCAAKLNRLSNILVDNNAPITSYEGRGHIVLHELTHLDQIAQLAGLPERGGACGTEDWKSPGRTGNDSGEARKLKVEIATKRIGGQKVKSYSDLAAYGLTDPAFNAESYAAVATEYWFTQHEGAQTPFDP